MTIQAVDVVTSHAGACVYFHPVSDDGRAWLVNCVDWDEWQWQGDALIVDPDYAPQLIELGMDDGLVFQDEETGRIAKL